MDESNDSASHSRSTQARHFAAAPAMSRNLVLGLILAVIAESVAVHALMYERWPVASLALLLANVLTFWWVVREARAESRTTLEQDRVIVRHGRSVRLDIPLASVREARVAGWKDIPAMGTSGYLALVSGDDPNVLLSCNPPARARMPLGLRRSVHTLGLRLDVPGEFVAALEDRRT